MAKLKGTLKTRLTLFHVLIFGLLQAALWITVDVVRTNQLRHRFDQELVDHAQAIARAIRQQEEASFFPLDDEVLGELLRPSLPDDLLVQVTLLSGASFKSTGLSGYTLPLEPVDNWPDLRGAPIVDDLEAGAMEGRASLVGHLRLVTLYESLPPDGMMCVEVAADSGPIDQSVRSTRALLFIFVITSMLVAAITSWFLVHRSLGPVGAVIRKARKIEAARLHERIPRPSSEDEVAQMIDVINGMLDRLESEFRNQQQFISHASHELRTPLAVILTESDGIGKEAHPAEKYELFVQTVREEAQKLLRIVDSFLLLTRAQSGTRPAIEVPVPVEDIVIEATRRTKAKATTFQVKVVPTLEFPPENPEPIIRGDTDLLYSMLENIVRNAIRHSPPDGVVEVSAHANTKEAILNVSDRGTGIPADHLDKIFNLFHQVSPQSKKSGKVGVGLSIAKAVAELHGGTIVASNRDGGGAVFTIRLPVERIS